MVYLRRVYNSSCSGFALSLDPNNPMGLVIGSGVQGNGVAVEATSVTFPVSDGNQHVEVRLFSGEDQPLNLVVRADSEEPDMRTCTLMLAHFTIPPNCSDLSTLDLYIYGFVNDKLYETPFEGDEPVWEIIK